MTHEKLGNCGCIYKSEKDYISWSLQISLIIVDDLIKAEKDEKKKKVFIGERSMARKTKERVDNTPLCK